jgi:hypothetical protein
LFITTGTVCTHRQPRRPRSQELCLPDPTVIWCCPALLPIKNSKNNNSNNFVHCCLLQLTHPLRLRRPWDDFGALNAILMALRASKRLSLGTVDRIHPRAVGNPIIATFKITPKVFVSLLTLLKSPIKTCWICFLVSILLRILGGLVLSTDLLSLSILPINGNLQRLPYMQGEPQLEGLLP